MKNRMFGSVSSQKCPYGCIYCFVKADSYKRGIDIKENISNDMLMNKFEIIQPACDSELLLERDWFEVLKKLTIYNKSISFATKKEITDKDVEMLKNIDAMLKKKGQILNVGITICRYEDYTAIEPFAPKPEKRIEGLKKLYEAGIGCNVIIRPIFPDSDISDLLEIVNRTISFSYGYLLGPLYVNEAVRQYIQKKCPTNSRLLIEKKKPEWNQGEEMEVIYSPSLVNELRKYIIGRGNLVFDNNEECVFNIRNRLLGENV